MHSAIICKDSEAAALYMHVFFMQVQYPGVATSIESDIDNLMRLVMFTNILPKGMYIESAVKVREQGEDAEKAVA